MVRTSQKIRKLVVEAGLVSEDGWAEARNTGKPVLDVLIESGAVDENLLYEVLAATSGIAPMDLTRVHPDQETLDCLPQDVCQEHCVLPVARLGDHLTVAVYDPFHVLLTACLLSHSAAANARSSVDLGVLVVF